MRAKDEKILNELVPDCQLVTAGYELEGLRSYLLQAMPLFTELMELTNRLAETLPPVDEIVSLHTKLESLGQLYMMLGEASK